MKAKTSIATVQGDFLRDTEESHGSQAVSAIDSFVRGSSKRLFSSANLGWRDISLELHDGFPAYRADSTSSQHIIAVFRDYVVRGEHSLAQNRFAPYSYSPGAINLFPAGPIPACVTLTPARVIVCALDPVFVQEVAGQMDALTNASWPYRLNLRDTALNGIVVLLAAEVNSGGLSGRLYADHLTHALASRFLHLSGAVQEPFLLEACEACGPIPGGLRRTIERIRAEFQKDLDLETLAADSGYCKSHFLRIFRQAAGCSPYQMLTRLRIEHAKKLLRGNSASLIDVAAACGFSSHTHFSSRFRQLVGMTPSRFRRECN